MEKGYWNRKGVYSIRKFTVGACSVLVERAVCLNSLSAETRLCGRSDR